MILATASWAAVGTAGLLAVARQLELTSPAAVSAVVLAPYATAAAAVGAAALLAQHRTRAAIGAAILAVAIAVPYVSLVVPRTAAGSDAGSIVVLTANLRLGQADPAVLVAVAEAQGADIVAIQELTPEAERGLISAGIGAGCPFSVLAARPAAAGNGLWSRTPLTGESIMSGYGFAPVRADVKVQGQTVTVLSFHGKAPLYNGGTEQWSNDLGRLTEFLSDGDTAGHPTVVAGDFNATFDHRQFRRLLGTSSYSDAAADAGAGLMTTFPADGRFGPLAGLDHILLSSALVGTRVQTVHIPGSDHLAVAASISVTARE